MPSKLEILLDKFDPKNCWNRIERSGNEILVNYRIEKNAVSTMGEATNIICDFTSKFYLPHGSYEHGIIDSFYDLANDKLKKIYPEPVWIFVTDVMKSGREGGVYGILKKLTKLLNESLWESGIHCRIRDYIDDTTEQERESAAKEYVDKYNDLLSVNFRNDPLWVYINFEDVLFEHALTLRKFQGSYK
jgi:hypothetical protein